MTDFRGLIRLLVDSGVEFILVGGVAATAHGSARFTQDVDVVYARTPGNIDRLVDALAPRHPYLRGAPPKRAAGRPKDLEATAELEAILEELEAD